MKAVGRKGGKAVGLAHWVGVSALAVLATALPPYRLTALHAQSAGRIYEGQQQRPVAPGTGQLMYPGAVQQRQPTTERDDAEIVKALEHRIRCTCGCNLDVFTCRTTDFTCATSPAMHNLVLARLDSGLTSEQVIAAFETQYGQAILMQPPKRGFNWAAYVMPFVGLGLGLGFVVMLMKRWIRRSAPNREMMDGTPARPPARTPDAELDRLHRELEHYEA